MKVITHVPEAELHGPIVDKDVFLTLVDFLHYHSDIGKPASDALSAFGHHGKNCAEEKTTMLTILKRTYGLKSFGLVL